MIRFVYTILPFLLLYLLVNSSSIAQISDKTKALQNNAYFYIQHQNYGEALKTARQLPDVYDKYLIMGLALLHSKELAEAEKWLSAGVEYYPDSLKLSVLKAEVLFLQKKYANMLKVYHKIEHDITLQNAESTGFQQLTPKISFAYQHLARAAFHEGKFANSEKLYKQALQFQELPEIYLGLCLSLLEQEKWDSLIEYGKKALVKYPDQPDLAGLLANAYFKKGNYKALQKVYTKIYKSDPENVKKALTLGEVMMANKDFQAAQVHYDHLLLRFPANDEVYDAALQISSQYRNLESRIAILKRKNAHIPSTETALQLADAYQLAKEWNSAIQLYDSLIQTTDDPLDYQVELVKLYERSDSLTMPVSQLRMLAQKHPEEQVFGIYYVKALAGTDCQRQLINLEQISFDLNSEALTQKATILASCGQEDASRKVLLKAINKDTTNSEAYVLLAKISINDEQLSQDSFQYIRMAAIYLLKAIEEGEKFLKTLSLNNPFDPVWLEVPSLHSKLNKQKEELKEMISLASQHFSITQSESLLQELQVNFKENALLMFLSGQHYAWHRQKDEAINRYEMAIALDPKLVQAQFQWALLNEKSNKKTEAISGYEKVIAIDEQFEEAYDGLIRLYRKNGQLNLLTERWGMIYSNNRDNDVLKNALIEALHKQGKVEEAKAITQND